MTYYISWFVKVNVELSFIHYRAVVFIIALYVARWRHIADKRNMLWLTMTFNCCRASIIICRWSLEEKIRPTCTTVDVARSKINNSNNGFDDKTTVRKKKCLLNSFICCRLSLSRICHAIFFTSSSRTQSAQCTVGRFVDDRGSPTTTPVGNRASH